MYNKQKTMFPSFENRDYFLDLGEQISIYRKRAGMTQAQLAKELDIDRTYLSRIENPLLVQSLSLNLMFNISRMLNIPPYYLLMPLPDNTARK